MRRIHLCVLVALAGCARCGNSKSAVPPGFEGPVDGGWSHVRLSGLDWADLSPAVTPVELTHLSIDQLPRLESTRGLRVERVWAQTDVWNNPLLRDLSGLSDARLSGRIAVLRNPALESLGALKLVRDARFGLSLEVRGNHSLASLGTLGGPLEFQHALVLDQNPKLADIDALEQVRSCSILRLRELGVRSLRPLRNLRGDPYVSLEVSRNPALPSFEGLEGLHSLVSLVIEDNAELETIEALGSLESLRVSKLVIRNNPKLKSVAPLLKAKRIEGVENDESGKFEFEVSGNPLVAESEIAELRRRLITR